MDIIDLDNKEENDNSIINKENEQFFIKPEYKKIKLTMKTMQNIRVNIKKFLEKTKYDVQLFSDLTDEKFVKIITMLNSCNFIEYFSNDAIERYYEIKENDFKIDRNGVVVDIKESIENFSNYLESKREKYYNLLNGFFAFEEIVKKENLGVIQEENSFLNDDGDEEEIYLMNKEKKSNNNISNVINGVNKDTEKNNSNNQENRKINRNNNNYMDDEEEDIIKKI